MLSVEIIIPVRDMAEHARRAIESVRGQLSPDDRITIVDDGSTDDLADSLDGTDINVIRLPSSRGPYAARHIASAASSANILIFMDARCLALPGWLEAHRGAYTDPDVVMSCTGMRILGGKSLAGRICEATAMFDIEPRIGTDGRLDFFPTANLGIRAETYRAVGGFRDMRSGSDADLCRRVHAKRLGRIGFTTDICMEWVPRDSLSALYKQWIRYGASSARLDALYLAADEGSPKLGRTNVRYAARRLGRRLREDPSSTPAVLGSCVLVAVNRLAYIKTRRSNETVAPPSSFYEKDVGAHPLVSSARAESQYPASAIEVAG